MYTAFAISHEFNCAFFASLCAAFAVSAVMFIALACQYSCFSLCAGFTGGSISDYLCCTAHPVTFFNYERSRKSFLVVAAVAESVGPDFSHRWLYSDAARRELSRCPLHLTEIQSQLSKVC